MIEPAEALAVVLAETRRLEPVDVPLLDAVGAVLAETVASDIDLPPFDKSAMDGYAVRAADVARVPVELTVAEELPAGVAPNRALEPGTCAKIMTGAPVPAGADAVVRVEDTDAARGSRVRILKIDLERRNICVRGEDVREGEPVLDAGHVVGPEEVGLLASVGRQCVRVFRRPRVAVLATGNELVDVSAIPGPGQIRNANSWSLVACCRRAGVGVDDLGVARDDASDLRAKITTGLERDILLVSGGVSMGEWDLVPGVLEACGVTTHFGSVRMKPGKPTVFATRGDRAVFGLPGNPVSTLVAFRLFVWPCLRKMMGHPDPAPAPIMGRLAAPTTARGNRIAYMPARIRSGEDGPTAEPIETRGSADLVGFCRADALLILEPGTHEAGERVRILPLDA